jgi:GNAT superfamily N-acetyltransferase
VEVVEIGALSEGDWEEVLDGEEQPFGVLDTHLQWLEKDRNLLLRAPEGRLLGVAGATVVEVDVEGHGAFEVVGMGGLVVTRSARGHGLMSRLLDPLLDLARSMGPNRAMLFCRPELVAIYARSAFIEIDAPVWVDQPGGRVGMPMPAMSLALHTHDPWPPGRVDVHGLPF